MNRAPQSCSHRKPPTARSTRPSRATGATGSSRTTSWRSCTGTSGSRSCMRGRRRSSASSSRVRFAGARSGAAHRQWYRAIADHYDGFANPVWMGRTEVFLDRLFRRHGIGNAVDVACGTFAIDLRLAKRGYEIVGRDLSPDMIRVGRRALRMAGLRSDLGVGDIRIGFDEAPLKVWRKEGIARALAREGFRLVEWWGDLRVGSQYRRKTSPRLVVVACAPDRTGKFRETP